ncbi:hypothetical protein [Alloactinosynnema sp. L-07]|nr:hypothetical protein [Alloactinosynnema sp. L-07]
MQDPHPAKLRRRSPRSGEPRRSNARSSWFCRWNAVKIVVHTDPMEEVVP